MLSSIYPQLPQQLCESNDSTKMSHSTNINSTILFPAGNNSALYDGIFESVDAIKFSVMKVTSQKKNMPCENRHLAGSTLTERLNNFFLQDSIK